MLLSGKIASSTPHRLGPKPWCADDRRDQRGLAWVLLIDDDPCNTRALSRWLRSEFGMETRSAQTIAGAEGWLRSMPAPTAVVTDFDLLGGETGAGLIEHLRRLGVAAPMVVLTGAPSRAEAALWRLTLEEVPVLAKGNFHDALRNWLTTQCRPAHRPRAVTASKGRAR